MHDRQNGRCSYPYTKDYFMDIKKALNAGKSLKALDHTTVLITGATGLIGSAIADLLICLNESGQMNLHIVLAVRNREKAWNRFWPYSMKEYMKIIEYHAEEKNGFGSDRIDYIIHAAGNAHPSILAEEPVETMQANFIGLYSILDYTKNRNVKRIVYLSSSEIYGNFKSRDGRLLEEDDYGIVDLLNVRACYPSSKRAAETLLASFAEEYNIYAAIVRPGHIYGPTQSASDSRASAQFLNAAVKRREIVMKSKGEQLRSYCHCFDCATAILHVLLFGSKGEAYNISNPNSIVTIREFAEACARTAGCRIVLKETDAGEARSYNMMPYSALNSQKLENLGWRGAYNLDEGVAESIRILKLLL